MSENFAKEPIFIIFRLFSREISSHSYQLPEMTFVFEWHIAGKKIRFPAENMSQSAYSFVKMLMHKQ
ncbi:hypothetical protein [Streptococcus marmotae]|uniref:hypothetical protein n=1 Tax=Streptococcus marmotae TaxID=1825069 RepID=UPI000835CE95|nr:hypothetical protein [Streptococcus marmotae]